MEKIIQACIQTTTGELHQGSSHSKIIMSATVDNFESVFDGTKGFITTEQRFVDRKVAAAIALQCGQIKERVLELQSYMI